MSHDDSATPGTEGADANSIEDLPRVLPIFPLTGALLLPGGRLPLHIFEPRYRNMIDDAIEGPSVLGMIQPFARVPVVATGGVEEGASEEGENGEGDDQPEVYSVGCAGRIEQWQRLPDGRFLILLEGLARFRVRHELELHRGYRRVAVDYDEFGVDDRDREAEVEAKPLLDALESFNASHGFEVELERLAELPGLTLLNSIAMGLPFPPAEKQALLEASDLEARQSMLLTLLGMGLQKSRTGNAPTLH